MWERLRRTPWGCPRTFATGCCSRTWRPEWWTMQRSQKCNQSEKPIWLLKHEEDLSNILMLSVIPGAFSLTSSSLNKMTNPAFLVPNWIDLPTLPIPCIRHGIEFITWQGNFICIPIPWLAAPEHREHATVWLIPDLVLDDSTQRAADNIQRICFTFSLRSASSSFESFSIWT